MIRKSVAELLAQHVTYELEGIDRMYLNVYVPSLQTGAGFASFVEMQLGEPLGAEPDATENLTQTRRKRSLKMSGEIGVVVVVVKPLGLASLIGAASAVAVWGS